MTARGQDHPGRHLWHGECSEQVQLGNGSAQGGGGVSHGGGKLTSSRYLEDNEVALVHGEGAGIQTSPCVPELARPFPIPLVSLAANRCYNPKSKSALWRPLISGLSASGMHALLNFRLIFVCQSVLWCSDSQLKPLQGGGENDFSSSPALSPSSCVLVLHTHAWVRQSGRAA